ncbi:hypothetical protein SLEP1_g36842 [Rubroshorea leprosula]|uniref:Translation initiation factor 1 n=1 Tax=Rubroshorea leprosula TaxID=152421 RepID=A0AAV5KSU2_9ROSI|nr:hypothetical protein SLEP1_g36842 [Rubroshorea leprosula]
MPTWNLLNCPDELRILYGHVIRVSTSGRFINASIC